MNLAKEKANNIAKFSILIVAILWLIKIFGLINNYNMISNFSKLGGDAVKLPSMFSFVGIGFYMATGALAVLVLLYFNVIKLDKK